MRIPWNKGYGEYAKGEKNGFYGKHHSNSTIKKMKLAWEKRRLTPVSEGTRKKMSLSHKGKSAIWSKGIKNHRWIKDRSKLKHLRLWNTPEMMEWRLKVFTKDSFTCVVCGDNRGGNLNAHHKLSWKDYPEYRFDINNGITLCKKCHIKVHRINLI